MTLGPGEWRSRRAWAPFPMPHHVLSMCLPRSLQGPIFTSFSVTGLGFFASCLCILSIVMFLP